MTKMVKGFFDWIVVGRMRQVEAMMKNRTYWV